MIDDEEEDEHAGGADSGEEEGEEADHKDSASASASASARRGAAPRKRGGGMIGPRSVSDKQKSLVWNEVRRLRQACNHPQVGSKTGLMSVMRNMNTMTMDELSEKLIHQAKVEAEESLRVYVFCTNGLASLDVLNKRYDTAIAQYRRILGCTTSSRSLSWLFHPFDSLLDLFSCL